MQRRQSTSKRKRKSSTVTRKRTQSIINDKNVLLERIIGNTISSNNSISINPVTDDIAYIAGNIVVIFDTEENKQIHFLKNGTNKTIISVQYSDDGKYLAIGEKGKNPSIFIWKVINRKKPFIITKITFHKYGIKNLCFSEGNTIVMSIGDHDNSVCLWDISNYLNKKDSKVIQEITTPIITQKIKSEIKSVCYMKENNIFVTVGLSHVKSWSVEKLLKTESRRVSRYSDIHESKDSGISIPVLPAILGTCRNSEFIDICCYEDKCYSITSDGHLFCFSISSSNNRGRLVIDTSIVIKNNNLSKSISINEKWISISFSDSIVRLFDRISLEYLGMIPKSKPYGKESSNNSSNETVNTNDTINQYPDTISCKLYQNSQNLIVSYTDGNITSWNLSSYPKIHKNFSEFSHKQCIWDMKLIEFPESESSLNKLPKSTLVTCSADNTIRFWDTQDLCESKFTKSSNLKGIIHTDSTFKSLKEKSSSSGIRCIAISPNYKHIASGDRKGNIRIYDIPSLSLLNYKEAHDSEVLSLSYSQDNNLLASSSRDRLIHFFDSNSKNPKLPYPHLDTLDDHSSSITSIKFSKLNNQIDNNNQLKFISCSADKSVIFRNIKQSSNELVIERYSNSISSGTVYDMCLDDNNTKNHMPSIITTGKDKKLTRFDVKTGKIIGDPIPALRDSEDIIKLSLHKTGVFTLASSTDKCLRMYSCPNSLNLKDKVSNKENTRRFSSSSASKCLLVANGPSLITSSCFSPCSTRIFGTTAEGMIFIWRISPNISQKISHALGTPVRPSPRVETSKENQLPLNKSIKLTNTKPTPTKLKEISKEEVSICKTWTKQDEIQTSLESEYGLQSDKKSDKSLEFLNLFSNQDDAKLQALRRLTIEPSTQNEPTINDSEALANALSDDSDNFFDFGNFSDIPEVNDASRLSISQVFRQNSSPRNTKQSTSNSPISAITPLNINSNISYPKSPNDDIKITPISLNFSKNKNKTNIDDKTPKKSVNKECIDDKQETVDNSNHETKMVKDSIETESNNHKVDETTQNNDTTLPNKIITKNDTEEVNNSDINVRINENTKPDKITPTTETDIKSPSIPKTVNSPLNNETLTNDNNNNVKTSNIISEIPENNNETMNNQSKDKIENNTNKEEKLNNNTICDMENKKQEELEIENEDEDVNEIENEDSNSYDLLLRHQVAMNLLQNAFENCIQLYEDANFEYDILRKEETQSPYTPVYEQILDNYEQVFHSLSTKLVGQQNEKPPNPQLEQYSIMLTHLATLIKDKQIVP